MTRSTKAVISPSIDFLCAGGLSIIVICGLLVIAPLLPSRELQEVDFQQILLAHVLINWPHFMASYRLLYRSREQISQYRFASVYVPLFLVILCAFALIVPSEDFSGQDFANATVLDILVAAGMFFLAWHYTGQAWGMTASFCFIAGIRMSVTERLLIRSGYRSLLVLHLLWALTYYDLTPGLLGFLNQSGLLTEDSLRSNLENVCNYWTIIVMLSMIAGIIGFYKIRRRTGITPPWRAIVPWVAIYFWYALILLYPGAFPVLQISHALQYIIFPMRVEMNRYEQRTHAGSTKQKMHALRYFAALVAIGIFVHKMPELTALVGDSSREFRDLVVGSVNLHHYFIDGAIWKISNPAVRRDLFSHL